MSSPTVSEGTLKAVIDAIAKETGKPVTAETRLVEDLSLDSLEVVTLTMALEDEFELKMDYSPRHMQTVRDIAAVIQQLMIDEGRPGAA